MYYSGHLKWNDKRRSLVFSLKILQLGINSVNENIHIRSCFPSKLNGTCIWYQLGFVISQCLLMQNLQNTVALYRLTEFLNFILDSGNADTLIVNYEHFLPKFRGVVIKKWEFVHLFINDIHDWLGDFLSLETTGLRTFLEMIAMQSSDVGGHCTNVVHHYVYATGKCTLSDKSSNIVML